ncbi:hypothetical protein [Xanthocytophaga agilis]|uniref:Uncharacterized protein n=1 Tax=Xanthocytophaga agilis TaxID=3048010 RepID=A0AAE3R447_9BACT|nr:hypothetical protein [Xanthocytophaga agilis]MDJ1503531.1 hypothetical protein [Xanthocytophaga agilis]
MAKTKKQVSKAKLAAHKRYSRTLVKGVSDAFILNTMQFGKRMTGLEIVSLDPSDVEPFSFVITIEIKPNITIKWINVNGVIAEEEDFDKKDEKIICKISAYVSTFTFLLIIDAEGDSGSATTFNMTCDKQKVFEEDQEIKITDTGRGGYSNPKVSLP